MHWEDPPSRMTSNDRQRWARVRPELAWKRLGVPAHWPGSSGGLAPGRVHHLPRARSRGPRSWVENSYPNVTYFNEVDRGGHFAAWEEPELFSAEMRAAFRSLR